MVKVCVEVSSGSARSSVAIRNESIRQALDLAGQRHPGADAGVRFPEAKEVRDEELLRCQATVMNLTERKY